MEAQISTPTFAVFTVHYQPDPSIAVLRVDGHHVIVQGRCGDVDDDAIETILRHMRYIASLLDVNRTHPPDQPYLRAFLRHVLVDDWHGGIHFTFDVLHDKYVPLEVVQEMKDRILDVVDCSPDDFPMTATVRVTRVSVQTDSFAPVGHQFYEEWLR